MAGLEQAMAALMGQFGQGGTVAGTMPSAYQTNQAAASVPSWTPAASPTGNAPMASPLQSVPGMTSQSPVMGALSNPQSWGSGGHGGLMSNAADMAISAGLTAALTPVL